jgi:prepilin-type processing-associated H-X9-DG protein
MSAPTGSGWGNAGGIKHKMQSYGANIALVYGRGYKTGWTDYSPLTDAEVDRPAEYVMFADCEAPWWPYAYIYPRAYYYDIGWPSNKHTGKCNAAYCDGHAKVVNRVEIWGWVQAEWDHLCPPPTPGAGFAVWLPDLAAGLV